MLRTLAAATLAAVALGADATPVQVKCYTEAL